MTRQIGSTGDPVRNRWARHVFVVALGVLLAIALYFVFQGQLNADEGFYLLASKLARQGFRPYRDFGFTQGPVLPYVNVPWLELFGYTLDGQRLTSLVWMVSTVIAGTVWLKQRYSWSAGICFVVVLIGAPAWIGYMVKGKTYAFGSLCIMAGAWALLGCGQLWVRWVLFVVAAGLGVGARFPLAGFFLPAGVWLLITTPTWRGRLLAIAFTAGCAALLLWWATAGSWPNFVFWTMQFHREALFRFPLPKRLFDALRYAPGVWMVASAACVVLIRKRQYRLTAVLGCLWIAVFLNISAPSTYAEYLMPFVPAMVMVAAPVLSAFVEARSRGVAVSGVLGLIITGWLLPLERTTDILLHAGEAEAYLRNTIAPGSRVVGSMPEIAVAAGMTVPLPVMMGKFAVTEDYPANLAADRLMATPAAIAGLIGDRSTSAVVLSAFATWNFSWSVPSYRPLSLEAQNQIRSAINRDYHLAFENDDYLIFLRTHPATSEK